MNQPIKILLVDDIEANLLALEPLLEADDRELVCASSGEAALEILLKDQDFAVILMDVQMPGLDGFETVQLLKSKESCQRIPIVFLTAFDREGSMEVKAYASGAVDYVMKPIQPQILISKVDIFVDLYRTHQALKYHNKKLEVNNLKLTREVALRESAESQLILADQAIHDTHESVVITDEKGVVERINPAFSQLSGLSENDVLGHEIIDFTSEYSDVKKHELLFAALIEQGEWQGELLFRRKSGEDYNVWAHISGIYNQKKRLTHYCAILSEINNAQKIETTLRKVKLRLEKAQHISHLGGWEWNISDDDIYFSDELFHILDSNPDSIKPSIALCRQFIHPEDIGKLDHIMNSLRAGKATNTVLRVVLSNGDERIVHEQTEVHTSSQGNILQLIGTIHDITEHTKLEESFMQAQKMEAVGAMVGGIAHEFNNVLAGMNGHMYMAKIKASKSQDVMDHLVQLEALSSRAAQTIQQMLTFSRKGIVDMKPVFLNALIKETLNLHKTSVPEKIDLMYDICHESLSVTGDMTLLQQMLLNLIINARDALTGVDQPSIKVCLETYEADQNFLQKNRGAIAGVFAHLSIQDNGCGMKTDNIKKIFEPFFTSKGHKGTGLGLSMVYGAVKSHRGYINVESELGVGSTFHAYLPLLHAPTQVEEKPIKQALAEGQGETVLIADDEAVVREMTCDALELMGYRVITAKDGQEAVEIFMARESEIDLVVLDVVMPGLGGVGAAKAIRECQSNVKIVFITGYHEEDSLDNGLGCAETIVKKPFEIDNFSWVVRGALTGL
ncbi:MAG: response regulator [Mariprofundaceae bacterium]|nr:response regulator [Mariprofundaceae bacterium]